MRRVPSKVNLAVAHNLATLKDTCDEYELFAVDRITIHVGLITSHQVIMLTVILGNIAR